MTRFRKAVDLWDASVIAAIESGNLRLQRGQWVRCGSDKLSRLVGITLKDKEIWHINALHYPQTKTFCEYIKALSK